MPCVAIGLPIHRCAMRWKATASDAWWRWPPRLERAMIHWALIFFVIALVAALLGFRGVAGLSAEIGYLFVVVAVIFLVIFMVSGGIPRGTP
jgi:uncharacterized membrane protein YtjA (UPF0391 family)